MTCCIRYYRPGRRDDAGLLIAKEAEFTIYKARLEAAGYVVLENIDIPPPTLEIPVTSQNPKPAEAAWPLSRRT